MFGFSTHLLLHLPTVCFSLNQQITELFHNLHSAMLHNYVHDFPSYISVWNARATSDVSDSLSLLKLPENVANIYIN